MQEEQEENHGSAIDSWKKEATLLPFAYTYRLC